MSCKNVGPMALRNCFSFKICEYVIFLFKKAAKVLEENSKIVPWESFSLKICVYYFSLK